MNKKKPSYKELEKKLTEAEELLAGLYGNGTNTLNYEYHSTISSTKELAEAFITSEQNFKSTVDECPLGIRIVTEDGELIYANKAALDIFGFQTVEALASAKKEEIYTPESYAAYQERKKKRRLREYVPGEYELDIKRPDSEVRNLTVYRREVMWGGEKQYMALYQDITERKRAEEEHTKSERRFHEFFEKQSNYCYMISPDGKILGINSAALEALGYTKEEIIGKPLLTTIYAPSSQDRARQLFERWQKTGELENEELTIITKGGKERTVLLNASAIRDQDGKLLHSVSIQTDITERKRVETALKESEEKYHSLVEHSNDGILFIQDGLIQYCNSKMLEMSGYTTDEVYGKPFVDFIVPEQKENVLEMYEKRIAGLKVPERYELDFISKDGNIIHTEISARLFYYHKNLVDIVIIRDITDRKVMDEAFRQSEEMFAKAFRSSPDSITITTFDDGIIIDANDAAIRNTGYSFNELIGHNVNELNLWARPEDREKMLKLLNENGKVDKEKFEFRVKSGEIRIWEYSAEPIILGGKKCIISVQRDITEQKQAEEALRKQQLFLSDILTSIQDGISVLDNNYNIVSVNKTMEKWYPHAMPLIGKKCYEAYQGRTKICEKCPTQKTLKTHQVSYEFVPLTGEGGSITGWLDLYSFPLIDTKTGEMTGIIEYVRDVTERKQAEEAQRESEREKAAILNGVSELVTYQDRELKLIWANRAASESVGTTPEELFGRHCYEIWQNRSEPCVGCPVVKAFETGQPHQAEMTSPDGRVWFVRGYPVRDEKRSVIGVTEITLEITERKQAEEAQRESEARFRSLFETMAQGVVYQDTEGKIISANPAAQRILGLTIDQIIGRKSIDPHWKSIHEDGTDFPGEEHPSMVALRTGKPVENTVMGVLNPVIKEHRWILINAIPEFRDGEETPYRVYTTFTDITERKQTEKARQESEERYRSIFENSKDAILLTSPKGRILAANQPACKMFGRTEEEIRRIGRKGLMDTSDPRLTKALTVRRATGEFSGELTCIRADGSKFPVDAATKIFYDKNGKERSSWIIRDITERIRMEQQLEEDSREIKLIIDSSPILVFYKDLNGKVVRVNKAFAEALNMTEEDFIGKTVFDLYSKDIAQGMTDDDREVFESGTSKLNIIEQYESATGLRWVQTDKIPTFDNDGKVNGLVGFAQDITERKAAEEALKESEEKFRILAEKSVVGTYIIQDSKMAYVNPSMARIFGYKPEEIIGILTPADFIHPDDIKIVMERLQERLDGIGSKTTNTYKACRKDGSLIYIETAGTMITYQGKPAVMGTLTDVTERIQSEEAIRESEERFNTAFHASPNLMSVTTLEEGRFIDVNEEHTRITGYERREIIGKTALELNMWAVPGQREEFVRILNTEGRVNDFESQLRTKSGEIKTVLFSAEKITLRSINCLVIAAVDITERKEAEERINHLNLTLRSIRNVSQVITKEKDRSLLIQKVCDSLVESQSFYSTWIVLLDDNQQPVIWAEANMNHNFHTLIDSIKQNKMPDCVKKALKQKQVVITKDPEKMCQDCPVTGGYINTGSMTARLEIEGKIYGVICASISKKLILNKEEASLFSEVATDIAFALRDMELVAANELQEQERLRMAKLETIGMLAGGIAHDFNNLLTGVMGNIGLVKTYISPSDPTYDMLDAAEGAAVRARDLTQQLLTFAKGGKPVKRLINTAELIKESAEFALRGSKVKLALSITDDVWQIEADEGQINQVFNNMVINADEAMPGGGTLKIIAENRIIKKSDTLPIQAGYYVLIDIADTGTGISPQHLQRIFEPYFTTKQRGSGLGLTTAYSVVRNHGGIILVESVQNKGTTFHIYLPATKKAVKGAKKLTVEESGQAGGKVLIMDDEEIIRQMLERMLGMAGYTVEVSADGDEALMKYEKAIKARDPFNAVIMDLTIPGGMGGKEAVKKILEIDPKATVIVSSGYATDPIMSDYKKYGFKAVIAKPYSVKQLRDLLSKLLTKKRR